MARYEHLPVYGKAMDLAVYLEKIVRNFSHYQTNKTGNGVFNPQVLTVAKT